MRKHILLMWRIYRPTGNLLTSLAELVWFKPGLPGCLSVLPLTRLLTSSICSNVWGSEGIHWYIHTLRSGFRVGGRSGGSFQPSLSATCQIRPGHWSTLFSYSTLLLEGKARRTWVCVCYSNVLCLVWPFVNFVKDTNLWPICLWPLKPQPKKYKEVSVNLQPAEIFTLHIPPAKCVAQHKILCYYINYGLKTFQ